MFDQMLSKSGRRVASAAVILLGALVLWATITEPGPAAWLIDVQSELLGRYSLKLTAALLLLPALLLGYGVGFLYDYWMGQGRFRPRRQVRIVAVSRGRRRTRCGRPGSG